VGSIPKRPQAEIEVVRLPEPTKEFHV
jgi:hypothetical protein